MVSDEWCKGWDAFVADNNQQNPYPPDTKAHLEWHNGYYDSQQATRWDWEIAGSWGLTDHPD